MHDLTKLILAERRNLDALLATPDHNAGDALIARVRLTALEQAAFITLPGTLTEDLDAIVTAALTDEMPGTAPPRLRLVTTPPGDVAEGNHVAVHERGGNITAGTVQYVDGIGIGLRTAPRPVHLEIPLGDVASVRVLR